MEISSRNTISRKHFIESMAFLAMIPGMKSTRPTADFYKLSFSTLGCPDWGFDKIIDFAKDNHYTGIEVRGILHEMELTKVPEFSSSEAITVTMKKMKDRGLVFVDLGSSCALHFA